MDYIIAIPSYKRSQIIKNKTIKTLQEYNIPKEKIYIFVADEEEEVLYRQSLSPESYHEIIVAEPGLHNARNFINLYFPVGQKIVEIDDDVTGFLAYNPEAHRHEERLKDLDELIRRGFEEAERYGAGLWGIYPSANGFFMRPTVSLDLRHIVGAFWGQINPGNEICIHLESKEDYERTLQFFERDGVVVRLNFVSPKTSYYRTPGGLQETRTVEKIQREVQFLLMNFPNQIKVNPHRKTGFPEIKLISKS